MIKKLLLTTLLSIGAFPALACGITATTGAPQSSDHDQLVNVCKIAYQSAYNPATLTPRWVAEYLIKENVQGTNPRIDAFAVDPELRSAGVPYPVLSDYVGARMNGWVMARGHLAPADDFSSNSAAARQSFYLGSNIMPQVQRCNNSGVWAQIERIVRDWAVGYGEIHVVTGTVYQDGIRETIGANRVAVPSHMFKIIYNPTLKATTAFLVPNVELCGRKPREFLVNQDQVEALTSLKFFPTLQGYARNDIIWP